MRPTKIFEKPAYSGVNKKGTTYQHVGNWRHDVPSHRLHMLRHVSQALVSMDRVFIPYFSPSINIFVVVAKK
jgi:hypothetical protein